MTSWRISEKQGGFEVYANVEDIGNDLLVIISGGTKPHIGAIGMAQPRPSLKNPEEVSATGSVFTFIGHKEDAMAKSIAEVLARRLNKKVVVVAGMHWEGLEGKDIEDIIEICYRLQERIAVKMGGER